MSGIPVHHGRLSANCRHLGCLGIFHVSAPKEKMPLMRKSLTTLAIAVLLAFGWIASDHDRTPTSTPDQTGEHTDSDTTPTSGPVTSAATSHDRTGPDTEPPETDQNGSVDSADQSEPSTLTEQIAALAVAADDRRGYDRDEFGDYDRDVLLEASLSQHGCYLSLADDQCYDDAGEVHADHIVALAEAWRSGLAESDTEAIAEDPDNLWLLTASVNSAKSDDDPTEWLPPDDGAVCSYLEAYVQIKIEYSLTIDPAEHDALVDAAANCRVRS